MTIKNLGLALLALIAALAAIGCEQAPSQEWQEKAKSRPPEIKLDESGDK